ncbi:MAG: hypothetical protein JKY20_03195 [Alphaproteobacteria bacterium]|nr:hypothetical protein [Alphaproteobacteria bacterium]
MTQKHTKLADIREQCAQDLPGRIDDAFATYRRYIAEPPPGDPKLFSAYQAGAKAALAHIDALTKLARWAETPEADIGAGGRGGDDGESLLAAARAAVGAATATPDNEAEDENS